MLAEQNHILKLIPAVQGWVSGFGPGALFCSTNWIKKSHLGQKFAWMALCGDVSFLKILYGKNSSAWPGKEEKGNPLPKSPLMFF